MITVKVEPLSVNAAWKGRRFKSNEYKSYSKKVLFMLPKIKMPEPPYSITLIYGFSSKLSDVDNPTKPILDLLCQKYNFDDRYIDEIHLYKKMVAKGQEFFSFNIETVI